MQVTIFNSFITGSLLLFLAGLCFSCQRKSDFFFVQNEGAIMPVKVRGNKASDTFLVLLPGGPAGDGLVYSKVFPVFKKYLEPELAMVYYDQRGAGNCQGVYDTATLNLAQLSEDLNALITSIQSEYDRPTIYLLGYSYGGALGIHYLSDPQNQQRVAGFISLAGAFDRKRQQEQQNQFLQYSLDHWQAAGEIGDYEILKTGVHCSDQADVAQCEKDSVDLQNQIALRLNEVEQYNQFQVNAGSIGKLLGFAFFSQSNPIFSGRNEALHGKYYQSEFDSLLLSRKAQNITTPILLINGRWDTNVPFFAAQDMYEQIGTPPAKKRIIILERSGHLPMVTEPETLAEAILDFIAQKPAH